MRQEEGRLAMIIVNLSKNMWAEWLPVPSIAWSATSSLRTPLIRQLSEVCAN